MTEVIALIFIFQYGYPHFFIRKTKRLSCFTTNEKITVAVIDDHTLVRHAIINYLRHYQSTYNIRIAFDGSDVGDILQNIQQHPADILIMDLFMEGHNNIESIKALRQNLPDQKILVVSMCVDLAIVHELLSEGIHGYISKVEGLELLPAAIISLHEGKMFHSKLMTEALYFKREQKHYAPKPLKPFFSEREIRILELLWEEKTNKEIAEEIFLSLRSIEKTIQEMKSKADTGTTMGLMKFCMKHKLLK